MQRYVILRHETPPGDSRPSHWDLMLEQGGVLRTWALPQWPEPNAEVVGEPLPDHRLAYLTHEGEISRGRGTVTRWDQGTYTILRESETLLDVALTGQKFTGTLRGERLPENAQGWRFSFSPA